MKDLLQSENDVALAEITTNFAKERQEIVELAQKNLVEAQARKKEYYDRKRRQVVFKEGDMVLLDTKNLPLKTVNKSTELEKAKLAAKKVGPWKLILPRTIKRLNPIFNVGLLSHYQTNREGFPNRPIPKAVPLILDEDTGEELYIVEKLLKKRTRRRKHAVVLAYLGMHVHITIAFSGILDPVFYLTVRLVLSMHKSFVTDVESNLLSERAYLGNVEAKAAEYQGANAV
ncbi:Retrotransposon protein [Phytophthora cinnamomi]|uniref:Retrotransposon protein n=1 Tax=Phytophthora cinnamomi TaxID=4785 RepID=UPI003559D51C|nr:Retrotransposon protein [Phytophthora cinnamomi]